MPAEIPTAGPAAAAPADTVTVTLPAEPTLTPQPQFTAADIEKARKEEKDKLYPKITDFEQKIIEQGEALARLQAEKQAEIDSAAALAAEEARKAAEKEWEEKGAKDLIANVRTEFEQKIARIEAERQQEREIFAKEQSLTELQNYTQSAVQAALQNNEIAPELADFVTGNNVDEINASLNLVKAKSEAIVQSIASAVPATQPVPVPRGVSPTGRGPVGPMDLTETQRTYTPEEIRNLPMSEYVKVRQQLIGAASSDQRSRGMFS